jgi:hypothetical protein
MRQKNKEFFWKIVGPYCRRCGYNECTSALHLHHINQIDKEEKNDTLGYWLSLSRYELVTKLSKTEFTIFCSNCHIKLHTVLRKRSVFLNPVSVAIFVEMLNCMIPPEKIINHKFKESIIEQLEEIGSCREQRKEFGIDCDTTECGFCGIEKLFPKEVR